MKDGASEVFSLRLLPRLKEKNMETPKYIFFLTQFI